MSRMTLEPPSDEGTGAPEKLTDLAVAHGALTPGKGLLSGVIALALSVLSVLSVLAFRFPAHLTTPELRARYDVTVLRYVLFSAMVVAGGIAIRNLVGGRSRWLASSAFFLLVIAQALGGPAARVGEIVSHTHYVGLDFFILDLLGSALV